MNAKVQIQFPEQSIPFYTHTQLLDAHTIVLETTTTIQTLIDRIDKSITFLKTSYENVLHPSTFTELESLISIARYLSNDFCNTFDVQLENYKNSVTETKCDAGGFLDLYGLAHEFFNWLSSLIFQIKDELRTVKQTSKALCDAVFASLENLINIADYYSDNHRNTFKIEFEKFEAEWEATKNG